MDEPSLGGVVTPGAVLLVGDDPALDLLEEALPDLPVCRAPSVAAALPRVEGGDVWVVVVVDALPDGPGLDLVRSVDAAGAMASPLLLFGDDGAGDLMRAVRDGVDFRFCHVGEPAARVGSVIRGIHRARTTEEERAGDRRRFPRVVPAGLEVFAPAGCELIDLAAGGVAIRVGRAMEAGDTFELEFSLRPGWPRLCLAAVVLRARRDDVGRWSVAARFDDLPPRTRNLLLTATRQHISELGFREAWRQFRDLSSEWITPLVDDREIAELLQRARQDGELLRLVPATGGTPWEAAVTDVDLSDRTFDLEAEPAASLLVPGLALDAMLHLRHVGYLFETTLIDIGEGSLRCAHPATVYQSEKRSRLRHRLAETTPAVAEIESPRRDGSVHRLPVIDVSATGASFEVDLDRHLLYEGTPLDPFRVSMGDQVVLEERAEVRHVTARPGRRQAKVGVRFERVTRRATRSVDVELAAAGTFSAPSAATRARRLKFPNAHDEEVVALFNLSGRGAERFSGPVVIIPPAWRYTKESFAAYALSLVGSFERQGVPAAVLRLDFTHHRGESFVPPPNREGGRESVDFTLSHALEDILAAVRFAHANPLFEPTEVILFGCSFSAPLALAAAAREPRITHVVCPMGTPSTQDLVTSASGGLDYIGGYHGGARFGEVDFLGQLIDMDRAAADALNHRLALFDDQAETVRGVAAAITWIVGRDDGWVDPSRVQWLAEAGDERFEVVAVQAGHLPTHDDAGPVAAVATREVFRRLGLAEERVVTPAVSLLREVDREEWVAAPKIGVESPGEWWRGYLLGGGQDSLGFDVLGMTDAYGDFVATQGAMLDLAEDQAVLDAGAGTGQFWRRWLARPDAVPPRRVELVDLVPEALERAVARIGELGDLSAGMELVTRAVDLQTSALLPLQRYLRGEYHGPGCLRGRIRGLDDRVLARLEEHYRSPLAASVHAAIRGDRRALEALSSLDDDELAVVEDLGRAARLLQGALDVADLAPEARAEGAVRLVGGDAAGIHAGMLAFERLGFGRAGRPRPLPLEDDRYDRILASLLVPYLLNPDETLAELTRALRPGGVLVASTMKPDTDMSRIQAELVAQVRQGNVSPPPGWDADRLLDELRAYSSAAAFLLRLTEEGTFRFLAADQLGELMESAGLVDVTIRECFGDPPQAYVAAGRKPTDHTP